MPKELLAFIFSITVLSFSGQAQILRDCFTSSGVSSSGSVSGLTIHQSVGQASVIGNFDSKNLSLRQGFLQPLIQSSQGSAKVDVDMQVFPNPFTEKIHVQFSKSSNEVILLSVYAANGALLRSFKNTMVEVIQIDLSGLAQGLYILQVKTEKGLYTTKIQKL